MRTATIKYDLTAALLFSGNADDLAEAADEIQAMRNRVFSGEDPEEILYEYGLEPDYVWDLLW